MSRPIPRARVVNHFLVDHPVAAWLLWIFVFFSVNRAFLLAAPRGEPTQFGPAAWLTVGAMICAPLVTALLISRTPASASGQLPVLEWVIANAPLLVSYVALIESSPPSLAGLAFIEAVVLMALSTKRTRRRRSMTPDPGAPR
jgi:hypothetical protein